MFIHLGTQHSFCSCSSGYYCFSADGHLFRLIPKFSYYKQYFREYPCTAPFGTYEFFKDRFIGHIFANFIRKKRILDFSLHFLNLLRFMVFIFSLIHRDAINVSIDLFLVLKLIRLMLGYQLHQIQGSTWCFCPCYIWMPKPKPLLRTWEISPCCCSTGSFLGETSPV